MNIVIYNHSRYLNIAFWGVVLGELISLAHHVLMTCRDAFRATTWR